jgi:hypothetical protein
MSVKAVGIALKLTFSGMNQFTYFQTWFFTVVVVACCLLQINYLNMVSFPTLFVKGICNRPPKIGKYSRKNAIKIVLFLFVSISTVIIA